MNKRIKQLAEQAGFKKQEHFYDTWECSNTNIEMFADYVRYDETKACAKHYLEIMRDAVEAAKLEEREICALVCDALLDGKDRGRGYWSDGVRDAQDAIRQRGDSK